MQLWPLTLSTSPYSPRYLHAGDLNVEWIMIMRQKLEYSRSVITAFETMTYHHPQHSSDRSHFLHFLHNHQAQCMLEIWMDRDNNTKVRMVADKSNQQFETMTYPFLQCNFGRSHFLLFHHYQAGSMLDIWIGMIMKQKLDRYNGQLR